MSTPPFDTFYLFIIVLLICAYGFFDSRKKSVASVDGKTSQLHSLPNYFGTYTILFILFPSMLVMFVWSVVQNDIVTNMVVSGLPADIASMSEQDLGLFLNEVRNLVFGAVSPNRDGVVEAATQYANLYNLSGWLMWFVVLVVAIGMFLISQRYIKPSFRARNKVETLIRYFLILCACIAILTTVGIVASVLFESFNFFQLIPVTDFLFGTQWSPGPTENAQYGAVPLFVGTILITIIAMLIALPVGLLSAIYLGEYASPKVRAVAKPLLEILAGIPTVVYGFFAAITVGPTIRQWADALGMSIPSESALAAGLVMGIMIIPFISSLSDDVINAVPQSLRDGSYGLGSTKSETIKKVVLPAALPGIVSAVLLALSRAIGETMIVVMAAGLAANLTMNPLDSVTTVTVQIVTALVGDQEFNSAQTLVAFALGLVLFISTLILNVIALVIVRRFREQYD